MGGKMLLGGKRQCWCSATPLGQRERRAEPEGCCHVCPDRRDLVRQGPQLPRLAPRGLPWSDATRITRCPTRSGFPSAWDRVSAESLLPGCRTKYLEN